MPIISRYVNYCDSVDLDALSSVNNSTLDQSNELRCSVLLIDISSIVYIIVVIDSIIHAQDPRTVIGFLISKLSQCTLCLIIKIVICFVKNDNFRMCINVESVLGGPLK